MGAPFISLKCCYVCKNERGRISGGSPTNLSVEYFPGFLLYIHLSLSAIFNFTTKFDSPDFLPTKKKHPCELQLMSIRKVFFNRVSVSAKDISSLSYSFCS